MSYFAVYSGFFSVFFQYLIYFDDQTLQALSTTVGEFRSLIIAHHVVESPPPPILGLAQLHSTWVALIWDGHQFGTLFTFRDNKLFV